MNVQQDPAVPACRNRIAVAFCSLHSNLRFGRSIWIIALLAIAFYLASCPLASAQTAQTREAGGQCPPATQKGPVVDVLHGVSIPDPYRWLEDQDSAETRAWLDAENRCTEVLLRAVPGREQITKRLSELQKTDSFSPPLQRNGDYFFYKRAAGQDLYVITRRHGLNGSDEVLVDPAGMSADHSTSVSLSAVTDDAATLAYGVRSGGKDEVTMHFLDVKSRKDLPDVLPIADYFSLDFEPNGRGVYYSRTTNKGPRVMHHVMGSDPASDTEIFGTGFGAEKIIQSQLSHDGRDLLILIFYGSGSTRTDVYFKDLTDNKPVQPIVNDTESLFMGEVEAGKAIIGTNWKAPKWHIYSVDLKNPSRDAWKEIVPESDASFESVALFGGKIYVQYVRNVVSQVKIFDLDGKPAGEVPLPSLGAISSSSGNWDSPEIFLSFESFNVPPSIYRYDLHGGGLKPWVTPKVPLDPNAYTVEQVWYESKDKTRVPMFLFYKKGMVKNGATPVWLTSYGGFDVNLTPSFYPTAVEWADAGGILAQPNIRGGGEFGEAWHQAGMMEKKQNVFDDFIGAAEWLIANHYTSSSKLAIEGTSNGGLLMGAMMTQRPDLFRAIVCGYPLLDMLRFQKFMKGSFWVPEYGSADDPVQFKYILKYSPYQNVKDGTAYPAVLFITGDGDTRVAPLHARKMAARLQSANNGPHPILLLYDTKSGHSGGRPLSKQIEEQTDALAFVFAQLGIAGAQ
jgi:prolyl oligopeptidase